MSLAAIKVEKNWPLSDYTSWRVGGRAEHYCAPENSEQLKSAMTYAQNQGLPVTVLGGGTNALISDQGIAGFVIHMIHLNEVQVIDESDQFVVRAQAGALKSDVLKLFLKQKLAPAIFLAGLPGDMGGGVVMNAGVGHDVAPKEFNDIVRSINVIEIKADGSVVEKRFKRDDINWVYRRSYGWQPGIIESVEVAWANQPDDEILVKVRNGNRRRKETQPLSQPSCGSVFKNPPGDHAGRLIEATGLKGLTIGGAQVSTKHANFIVNLGNASALDIHKLMCEVQEKVKKQWEIELSNEVVYLGRWDHIDSSS